MMGLPDPRDMATKLDPDAVRKANQRLWDANPELKGRQLSGTDSGDADYRAEWWRYYKEAALENAKADADGLSDKPVGSSTESCPSGNGPEFISNGKKPLVDSDKYKDCPDSVKKKIHSKEFTDKEKKNINEVLDKYKPILKCKNSPVKQIGRTNKAISKNGKCRAETDTMGEWFEDSGTVILTDAANNPVDFDDAETQFKGTAAHEIAHGLLDNFDPRTCTSYENSSDNPLMKEFHKAAGWDPTGTTLTETDDDKAPTDYAKTNDEEDLSESMMLYLYDPDKLKDASPARYEFCKKLLSDSE
jgi:hypothetical protein